MSDLQEVILTYDELEAIRLCDLQGCYQDLAAKEMEVSRQTFGRIIESAHRKVAEALCNGKALRIVKGDVKMIEARKFSCSGCGHNWEVPYGTVRPQVCPQCKSTDIHRSMEDRGQGGSRGCGRHRGWRRREVHEQQG